ncbi:hypothetical protein IAR55_004106 [Kwoniella newhampshirensis]|uniref:Transcription initiation factor TFIID subunit 12 domain-containing protein n=1 Tax=Kwoniella newhampshirensis TaxID=1651941 RepID=A0AAW0YY81_9TREE
MSRPPPQAGAGTTSTGTGIGRPPNPHSVSTIQTILHNLPNLFQMHERGTLSDLQINQLRQLMHTHFRQIIASSIAAHEPNPLLSLPPAIDPTLPWQGRPPLISKEAYSELIAKTTAHIKEAMAKRTAELQAVQMARGGGPSAGVVPNPSSPMIGNQPTGIVRPGMTGGTGGVSPRLNGQAGGSGSTPVGAGTSGMLSRPSNSGPLSGLLTHEQLRGLAKLQPLERQEWLSRDPARLAQFNMSLKYWQTQSRPADTGAPRPPLNAQQSRPPPAQPTASSPAAGIAPAAAAISSIVPPAALSSSTASTVLTASATAPASTPDPTPGPSTIAPSVNSSTASQPNAEQSASTTATPDTITTTTIPPAQPPQPEGTAVFLPSAATNPASNPAFATALPDARMFELKPPPPPPPPPEPEDVRRRRKWIEFVEELAPGMEVEQGVDEVLGDILDGMIEEGVRGAVRMAKHRKAEKVELKDMAFFIDRLWDTVVPGFDAMPHKRVHAAPERERERRKAKTVNPRAGRTGGPRGREED